MEQFQKFGGGGYTGRPATGTHNHLDDGSVVDVLEWPPGQCDDPRRAPEAVSTATGHADRRAWKSVSALVACALITVITVGELAGGRSPVSAARTAAAARVFNSPHNGYAVALPAGWSAEAGQPFDGPGGAGLGKDGVDVFHGPPYVVAWAFAAPRPPSLAGYATATARAAAQLPCPAVPQIDQQVTIGGAAALLIGMTCPAQSGVYMLLAAAAHNQTALVFVFEDSSGVRAAEQADRAAFGELLAGIRFRR